MASSARPIRRRDLGADDRAGVAVVLSAALAILRNKLPHPPLTFFWPIQEEIGLYGARFADLGLLGEPKLAFNWDGGSLDRVTVGATGGYRMQIDIEGLASHAGVCPEQGVSAIAIAGLAIAELAARGLARRRAERKAARHEQHRRDRGRRGDERRDRSRRIKGRSPQPRSGLSPANHQGD